MKSKFQIIVAAACLAILTACGGGSKKAEPVVVVQPAYQIKETTVGAGTLAENGDLVTVAYVGYLYDASQTNGIGAKLESSVDTQTTAPPFILGVGAGLTTGWDQSILGMRVGGVRLATLPANLAYGTRTRDAQTVGNFSYAALKANTPLVYELQLISVVKPGQLPNEPGGTSLSVVDVVPGTGTAATAGRTVGVRYTGWLYDRTADGGKGKQFDTNLSATSALSFVIDATPLQTISGFNTGVKDMKVGGKRTIYIPAALGYGPTATGGIPANSNLIFDVELTSVN